MTDKDKIIKELKEALDSLDITNKYRLNIIRAIEYLQEEPVSEYLENAASSFARKDSEGINNPANFYYTVADKARIFKAGAKWQKQQMMKDAIEQDVDSIWANPVNTLTRLGLDNFKGKVKLKIIKQEEK